MDNILMAVLVSIWVFGVAILSFVLSKMYRQGPEYFHGKYLTDIIAFVIFWPFFLSMVSLRKLFNPINTKD